MLERWLRRLLGLAKPPPDLPEALQSALDSLTNRFQQANIDHAIIGGVAVAMHGNVRATVDLDLLVDSARADIADTIMRDVGFERLSRNPVFANYLIGPLRVDLLFTQGRHTRAMLARAQVVTLRRGTVKLVQPADMIGLKLQALANNPERATDRSDIEILLRQHQATMDMALVREYFVLFGKEAELDALLEAIHGSGPGHAR